MSSLKSSAIFTDFSSIFDRKEFHLTNIRRFEFKKEKKKKKKIYILYLYRQIDRSILSIDTYVYDIGIALNLSLAVKIWEFREEETLKRFQQLGYAI